MTSVPEVNAQTVIGFFQKLFPHKWPGVIAFEFLKKQADGKARQCGRDFVIQESLYEYDYSKWPLRQAELQSIYFTATFRKFGTTKNRKEDVAGASILWADKDDVKEYELDKLVAGCPLQPSIVVWTGNGFHFYWVLDRVYTDVEPNGLVEVACQKVHKWVAGDHTFNINRILRVPGTYNVKPDRVTATGGFPLCAVVWEQPNQYSLEQVLAIALTKQEIRLDPLFVEQFIVQGNISEQWSKPGKDGLAVVDRSLRDYKICVELFKAKHTPDEVRFVLTNPEWAISAKAREKESSTYPYVEETVLRAQRAAASEASDFTILDDGIAIYKRFYAKNGMLEQTKLSNFSLTPLAKMAIIDPNQAIPKESLKMQMRTQEGRFVKEIVAEVEDFAHPQAFFSAAGSPLAAFYGKTTEWGMYLDFLSRQEVSTTLATKMLGWTQESFVVPGRTLVGQELEYVDTAVNPAIYISDTFEPLTPNFMRELWRRVRQFHQAPAAAFAFGWLLSSAFAPQIRKAYYDQFPILSLTGGTGTGKTTLIRDLSKALYGVMHEFSGETTVAVLKRALSYINALPVIVDEFEPTIKYYDEKLGLLRSSWQNGYAQMMGDRNRSIVNLKLQAPVVLTSIVGITEPALQSRCLTLRLTPYEKEPGLDAKAWFGSLEQGQFLNSWIRESQEWIGSIKLLTRTIKGSSDRQQLCFAVAVAPLMYLAEKYGVEDISLKMFIDYWQEQSGVQEVATALGTIDLITAYCVRTMKLMPMTANTPGYTVEGDQMLLHRAHWVDLCVMESIALRLTQHVSRPFVTQAIKDLERTGEVAKASLSTARCGRNATFTKLNLNSFPLTKEAVLHSWADVTAFTNDLERRAKAAERATQRLEKALDAKEELVEEQWRKEQNDGADS